MAAPKTDAVRIALTPAAEAERGAYLVQQAQGIVIRSKADHIACREFLKGAKALKKAIVEHYDAIKTPLNAARNQILTMEKRDLAPVELAIRTAEGYDTAYVREQQRIEEEAAAERRRVEEARIAAERQAEADRAEAQALKLEASSNVLSAREQIFVAEYVKSDKTALAVVRAAKLAGYKDYEAQAKRLIGSKKINDAIEGQIQAARIRAEAEAKQRAPIVAETPKVETQIGSVPGTSVRTYYSCDGFNTAATLEHLAKVYNDLNPALKAEIDRFVVPALETFLNSQARQLKDLFPQVWPMATLGKRDGVAG